MEFRLVYQGELTSRPGIDGKHKIRKCFHRQLARLWDTHPALRLMKIHNSLPFRSPERPFGWTPLSLSSFAERFSLDQFRFVPLVSDCFATCCGLDVLYLRPRDSTPLIHLNTGDIDNRLKTLFDALRLPRQIQEIKGINPLDDENPFFCLLEDDRLITEFKVAADDLLVPGAREGQQNDDYAHVIISVKIKLVEANELNLPFS